MQKCLLKCDWVKDWRSDRLTTHLIRLIYMKRSLHSLKPLLKDTRLSTLDDISCISLSPLLNTHWAKICCNFRERYFSTKNDKVYHKYFISYLRLSFKLKWDWILQLPEKNYCYRWTTFPSFWKIFWAKVVVKILKIGCKLR